MRRILNIITLMYKEHSVVVYRNVHRNIFFGLILYHQIKIANLISSFSIFDYIKLPWPKFCYHILAIWLMYIFANKFWRLGNIPENSISFLFGYEPFQNCHKLHRFTTKRRQKPSSLFSQGYFKRSFYITHTPPAIIFLR